MAAELQYIIHTEVLRIQKVEWLSAYVRARTKAFSSSNIISAFSAAGIYPYYPTKVIRRLSEIENNQLPSSESDPGDPLPLDPSLLPSSPIDVATFQTAKTALSQYMDEDPAFDTPVKIFVNRLAKSSERL